MTETFDEILRAYPEPPLWLIRWDLLESSSLSPIFRRMKSTPQEKEFHGEGDVWTHTQLVCEALAGMDEFRRLDRKAREILFTAALLHDAGKIEKTSVKDGKIVSPWHSLAGACLVRSLLWTDFQISGTPEKQKFRESICMLIRHHSVPPRILDQKNPERKLRALASGGEYADGFTLRLLGLLSLADVEGRITSTKDELIENVHCMNILAEEAGCLDGPYSFASNYTRYAYLSGRNVAPDYPLYEDCWGEVIMMCGLPGTGKDTWIGKYAPQIPMVSLDEIRRTGGYPPTGNQGPVVALAKNMAKEYLREKVPFVWNATCVSQKIREGTLQLIHDYHASARIVYLETGWEEQLERNRSRKAYVPEQAIGRMLSNLSPPMPTEAEMVEWICC